MTEARNPIDKLAEMLDQPADHSDRFHPHSQIKPSVDLMPDMDRLEQIVARLRNHVMRGESMPISRADSLSGEASRLVLRIKNRLTEDSEPEPFSSKRSRPWSAQ